MDRIDELLEAPFWIIDILPKQVKKDSRGQYFAIEDYFLKEQLASIKRKHLNVILKLNCYMDVAIEGETNPDPARTAEMINNRYVYVMVGDAMILSEPDDTHMTLFGPDERLLELVRDIAAREGLFVWEGVRS